MTKRKLAYPSLLIALFIIFVTEGDILFGYTKPDNQKEAEEKETVAQPRYIYLSPHAKVSHFDRHFHQAAENNEIDWLLLAAVAYTESRFDSTAVSEVGAKGVMQMMPNTLRGRFRSLLLQYRKIQRLQRSRLQIHRKETGMGHRCKSQGHILGIQPQG